MKKLLILSFTLGTAVAEFFNMYSPFPDSNINAQVVDDGAGGILIQVQDTDATGVPVRWVATMRTTEVNYFVPE